MGANFTVPPEDEAWLDRSDVDGVDGRLDVLMDAASSVAAGQPHIADGGRSRWVDRPEVDPSTEDRIMTESMMRFDAEKRSRPRVPPVHVEDLGTRLMASARPTDPKREVDNTPLAVKKKQKKKVSVLLQSSRYHGSPDLLLRIGDVMVEGEMKTIVILST